jgi:conjugal transfer ATP-binding protein TraC
MDTPFGLGIARLTVDKFSYWVYTSDAGEIAKIDALVDQGYSYLDAINYLIGKRATDAA